jgi:cytochrome b involved in lipid metabolism
MSKTFTRRDVASHSKPDDLWIIIGSEVFNISTFQHGHPGGNKGMYLTALSSNAPGKRKISSP